MHDSQHGRRENNLPFLNCKIARCSNILVDTIAPQLLALRARPGPITLEVHERHSCNNSIGIIGILTRDFRCRQELQATTARRRFAGRAECDMTGVEKEEGRCGEIQAVRLLHLLFDGSSSVVESVLEVWSVHLPIPIPWAVWTLIPAKNGETLETFVPIHRLHHAVHPFPKSPTINRPSPISPMRFVRASVKRPITVAMIPNMIVCGQLTIEKDCLVDLIGIVSQSWFILLRILTLQSTR